LKETDAALAEEKKRVADLERAKQDLAAQLAAKPLPATTSEPAAQQQEHKGEEESESRKLREENEKLHKTVLALQRQHQEQQDALAKVRHSLPCRRKQSTDTR
jgi:hypothetical protein